MSAHLSKQAACIALAAMAGALSACGGDTLDVGYDDARLGLEPAEPIDLEALANRCAAPAGEPTPAAGLSPRESLTEAKAVLVARWFACPGTALPAGFPSALELADGLTAYPLHDGGGNRIYVRDAMEPYGYAYSLRNQGITLTFRGITYPAHFERNPQRMSLESGGAVARFAKN